MAKSGHHRLILSDLLELRPRWLKLSWMNKHASGSDGITNPAQKTCYPHRSPTTSARLINQTSKVPGAEAYQWICFIYRSHHYFTHLTRLNLLSSLVTNHLQYYTLGNMLAIFSITLKGFPATSSFL